MSLPSTETLSQIRIIVESAGEGRNIEFKSWGDPTSPEYKSKIIKGCLALRNAGGGFLIFGLAPDGSPSEGGPEDPRAAFSEDAIQTLVSDFASEPFAVQVYYLSEDLHFCVVIHVPGDLRAIAVCRRDLPNPGSAKPLVKGNAVYYRTLRDNGTYSSSEAIHKDFSEIQETCWRNREWDIANFVKRHWTELRGHIDAGLEGVGPTSERSRDFDGLSVFEARWMAIPENTIHRLGLPSAPGTFTASFCWEHAGEEPALPTTEFLENVKASNPRLTGWPMWPDPRMVGDGYADRVANGAWERLVVSTVSTPHGSEYGRFDYSVMDPNGYFLNRRGYEDDLFWPHARPDEWRTRMYLELIFAIADVAEAIFVGQSITRRLRQGTLPENLYFHFSWNHLDGRKLYNWAHLHHGFPWQSEAAVDSQYSYRLVVPLNQPPESLGRLAHAVTEGLYIKFGGYQMPLHVVEEWVNRRIMRRN